MQTVAARRRSGREAQARYAERQRQAGVPTRLQVLAAVESGVRDMVGGVLAMEASPAKADAVKLLETLLQGAVRHLDATAGLDKRASRAAVQRLVLSASGA